MDFFDGLPRISIDPFAPWSTSVFGTLVLGILPPLCAAASLWLFGLTDPAAAAATLGVAGVLAAGASTLTGRNWAWTLFYGLFAPTFTALWWGCFAFVVAVFQLINGLPW